MAVIMLAVNCPDENRETVERYLAVTSRIVSELHGGHVAIQPTVTNQR